MAVDEVLRVDDPFTGEIVYERPLDDVAAVRGAVDRAQAAQRTWAALSLDERKDVVRAFIDAFLAARDEVARSVTRSMGKPIRQSQSEVDAMVDRARTMMSLAEDALRPERLPEKPGFDRFITRAPVGVVAVLAAWNYPLLIAINPMVAALLAGNSVVLKHSARTPEVADLFARLFEAAGAPAGLVEAVHCSHETTAALIQHPAIGFVSFTGSVGGGRAVYQSVAASRFVPVALELGGKDPAYVRADAPLDAVAEAIADGAFYNAGQSCCGIERVYVAQAVYEPFLAKLAAAAAAFRPGPPTAPDTTLGPMAQAGAPAFLAQQVEAAVAAGARTIRPGGSSAWEGQGRFFLPTILADTDHSMAIAREESFGPVLAVAAVPDDEVAVARMNDSRYGLTASVWTEDEAAGRRLLPRLEAGTVFLNRADFLDPGLAWTGVKDSGFGVSLSKFGFHAVTRPQSFHIRRSVST